MSDSSSPCHPRPTANSPPRKRVRVAHDEHDHTSFNLGVHQPATTISRRRPITPNNTAMASASATTNTYIPHNSLKPISLKIKKLQSDLSSAATGQCWGPGKQKVLDCKHDVDALATMVKGLDVDGVARKKSLDVLVEARIDQMFDSYIIKAKAMVNSTAKSLITDALTSDSAGRTIEAEIKKGLDKEPDVLVDFELKFEQCFKEALADAVAGLVAKRRRRSFMDQLGKF